MKERKYSTKYIYTLEYKKHINGPDNIDFYHILENNMIIYTLNEGYLLLKVDRKRKKYCLMGTMAYTKVNRRKEIMNSILEVAVANYEYIGITEEYKISLRHLPMIDKYYTIRLKMRINKWRNNI